MLKIANVCQRPVQAYIYQSNLLNKLLHKPATFSYTYKMKFFICNKGVETTRKLDTHGDTTSWRYVDDVTQTSMNKGLM